MKINGTELVQNINKAQLANMEKIVEKFMESNPGVPPEKIKLVTEYRTIGEIVMHIEVMP